MPATRFENVGIVVTDLARAKDFFTRVGLRVQGETTVKGPWVDETIGLTDVETRVCVMGVGEGNGQLELQEFVNPAADIGSDPSAPNLVGARRIAFAVSDLDALVADLEADGYQLRGSVARYRDDCLLCYVIGPDQLLIMLFEPLGD